MLGAILALLLVAAEETQAVQDQIQDGIRDGIERFSLADFANPGRLERKNSTDPDEFDSDFVTCRVNATLIKHTNSVETVANSLALNIITFTGGMLTFSMLLRSQHWASVLSPVQPIDAPKGKAPQITIDGWVLIRFCRFGFRFSLFGTGVGFVLVPVYVMSSGLKDTKSNFLRFTSSNLDKDTWKLWLIVVATYTLVAAFCWMIRCEWREIVTMRRDHFLDKVEGKMGPAAAQSQFSLMVERVPPRAQSQEGLKSAFERVFSTWHSGNLHAETATLYDKLLLSKACCRGKKRCCVKLKRCYRHCVNSLLRITRRTRKSLRTAHSVILDLRRPGGPTSTGFVTLTSVADRQIALQQVSLFHSRSTDEISFSDWVIRPAPEAPRDIIWRNVSIPYPEVLFRTKLGHLFCAVALLLWSMPLLLLQGATHVATLKRFAPHAEEWLRKEFPYFYSLLKGYLFVLATQCLLLLVPYMLEWISVVFEGQKQRSAVARKVLARNFCFQLISLYLLVIGGTVYSSVFSILKKPFCAGVYLGNTIPLVAVYFMNFVAARIGITLPLLLLRPYSVMTGLSGMLTKAEKEPIHCWFCYEGTNMVIVLVVANMYAVIAPIIMPLCVVYFALAWRIYRWLFTNVYREEFDCEGRLWHELFDGAMSGLLLGTLTVCGVVGLHSVQSAAFWTMWVLPVLIVVFYIQCKKFYGHRSHFMPFEDAVRVDRTVGPELVRSFTEDCYVDPILKVNCGASLDLSVTSGYSSSSSSDTSSTEDCCLAVNLDSSDAEDSKAGATVSGDFSCAISPEGPHSKGRQRPATLPREHCFVFSSESDMEESAAAGRPSSSRHKRDKRLSTAPSSSHEDHFPLSL